MLVGLEMEFVGLDSVGTLYGVQAVSVCASCKAAEVALRLGEAHDDVMGKDSAFVSLLLRISESSTSFC